MLNKLYNQFYDRIFGIKVGEDQNGNIYYQAKDFARYFNRKLRWVRYKGIVDGTKVSSEGFAWLHHQDDKMPNVKKQFSWQKDRAVNLTGTSHAYHPIGHPMNFKGDGDKENKDSYQPWKPTKK